MPVTYDSNKIIPAPFATLSKDFILGDDGSPLSHIYSIVLRGKIVAYKGSPTSSGTFHTGSGYPNDENIDADARLQAILRKQEALKNLFSQHGRSLEITPLNGTQPLKCNPRIKKIDFGEGPWFDVCDYVITCEADTVNGAGEESLPTKVVRASEEWNIETLDEKQQTYRLTRSLAATGKRLFDETGALLDNKQAWENAQDYVLNTIALGIDTSRMAASGVLNNYDLQAFNYTRSNGVNETAGIYSVTETWICYDPGDEAPAIHERNINVRSGINDGITTVSVEGTITGLEQRNNTTFVLNTTRFANAETFWASINGDIKNVAEEQSGVTLNAVPTSTVVGYNDKAGTISYSYEYNNRVTPNLSGATSETITIHNSHAADVFAQVPVLGRVLGPVLQSIGTVTAKKRSINIEASFTPSTQSATAATPNSNSLVSQFVPSPANQVFLEQDEESWTPNTGRYTRQVTFVWQ